MDVIFDPETKRKIESEVQKRHHEIEKKLTSFFAGLGEDSVGKFSLFGFSHEDCTKIQNTLTVPNYKKDGLGHQMISELFDVLGLEKFSFVSHHYADLDDGVFDILE